MSINTSDLKGFKVPLPVRGTVQLRIVKGRDVEGTNPDANGEKSKGLGFKYEITGPAEAMMTDGNSAIGYQFEESVWLPRDTLKASNPQVASRMKADFAARLDAAFGDDVPGEVSGPDFDGREIVAEIYTQFDDYAGAEVVKVRKVFRV